MIVTMPFGRHKGVPLSELSGGYLTWLHSKLDEWRPPLREAIVAEIKRRDAMPGVATEPVVIDPETIITAGVQALAHRHAGDHATMKQVHSTAGRLRLLVGPPRTSVLDAPHPDIPF